MHRIAWSDVPVRIRDAIATEVGGEIIGARSLDGGYSPSLAARLEVAERSPVFVKAVSSEQNPDSPHFIRREIDAMAVLPATVPAPTLLASIDDGHWVVAIFECIDGRLPHHPWSTAELAAALEALARLNATEAPHQLPAAADFLAPLFNGWQQLAARDAVPDAWAGRIDALVALERRALEVVGGDRLVHNDIRADNMLITADDGVVFVDWAHACRGPAWLDVALWACALELEGGGAPTEIMTRLAPRDRPSADALTAVVAACAGYFAHHGALPDPPGLPTLRAFQRAQGEIAERWLAELLEVPA